MAQLGEVAIYDDLKYEVMEIEGQKIRVATAETLLKLKENTIRPEDKGDAFFLRELLERKKSRMSVAKFKTHEAAKRALWCFEPDAEYYRRLAAHFRLAPKLCLVDSPKGVFKYRSVEERDAVWGRTNLDG